MEHCRCTKQVTQKPPVVYHEKDGMFWVRVLENLLLVRFIICKREYIYIEMFTTPGNSTRLQLPLRGLQGQTGWDESTVVTIRRRTSVTHHINLGEGFSFTLDFYLTKRTHTNPTSEV